ncbi:phosphopantetheine-binding protein [Rhodopseudomonas palustris]|uniref:Phosphopantetheine-binding protein n=1 Tax=Rhodopseudomonas palustris (strain ATCC BAA-98 / CGA009) TaxID=258594 RepID=Q6N110_RHOPA|nr:phosphopantetheine-binding protein [Rhodopseudomonas palustris]OPF96175.1 acyl carrier protein [Rhodopseudomonas palustris]PPQ41274.1 acyl carrier protein [Rhodopseudomonas palustris]QQM06175.1 Aminoacyl carrier protein 1 [Rhodopseudomonas palustris]RJF63083.1 acyl carrier protein [Rhodopseudomonas palustris]WAB77491.1 phosphopantetheine-binding protein [Rhodopseudomonas palustris]
MQAGPSAAVENKIITLVESILAQNGIAGGIERDTTFADAGLTSMEMVNLMLAVEAEFDMTLPQSDITPENFTSAATVAQLVSRRQHAQAA